MFQEDGTYILRPAILENPTTGVWQLIGQDELILEPDGDDLSISRIETLSKDKLFYSKDFIEGVMNSYTVTTSWKR